jgi:hypothetical protein
MSASAQTKTNTHANGASAQPMPGLSARAQAALAPRHFGAYSKAVPQKKAVP